MAFYRGQKVVCIVSRWNFQDYSPQTVCPAKDQVYTIRDFRYGSVGLDGKEQGEGILLHEIVNPPMETLDGIKEHAFHVSGFRPLVERKTDISIFTQMLTPNTVKHKENLNA